MLIRNMVLLDNVGYSGVLKAILVKHTLTKMKLSQCSQLAEHSTICATPLSTFEGIHLKCESENEMWNLDIVKLKRYLEMKLELEH